MDLPLHPAKDNESLSLLQSKDIDAVLSLSEQAGWNQTEADWIRLLALNPETCFVYRKQGRIAGSATLATYGRKLAWVGMVIVERSFRGRGIGKHLLGAVTQEALDRSCRIIGLDATEQGRVLYRQYGFHDVSPIDRWSGELSAIGKSDHVRPLSKSDLNRLTELDFRWNGYDRSALIKTLFREEGCQSLGVIRSGELQGAAFIRPGRQFRHLGPLLASTGEDCASLLDAAAIRLDGAAILIDAPRRADTSKLLSLRGLTVQRKLTRMTLGQPHRVLDSPETRAATAFEWG